MSENETKEEVETEVTEVMEEVETADTQEVEAGEVEVTEEDEISNEPISESEEVSDIEETNGVASENEEVSEDNAEDDYSTEEIEEEPVEIPETPALEQTDKASEAVKKKERVTLQSIKDRTKSVEFIHPETAPHMTIAVVTMANGFFVIGQSTPADPDNFDEKLGKQFAIEDAYRQIWPLEGYLLREKLSKV